MNSPSPNPSEDRPSKPTASDRFAREPEVVQIGGVELKLAHPYEAASDWIGQHELLMQLLACWLTVDESDLPLTPRLIGSPGVGKTQLAIAATKRQGLPLYIYQCTADTRPEDLLITPVLSRGGEIAYHASPLVTAMITGGVCILDEGNRMNEKSWASLAPLFDSRRYVESIVAGITIPASDEFRSAVTMNQDESTFEIPDYILSRLQPTLQVGFPNKQDEMAILQYHLPFAEPEMLALTVDFLQRSHELKLDFSPRDGINLLRFAIKRMKQNPSHPVAHDAAWQEALEKCLGDEAVDLESLAERRKRTLGGDAVPLGLADLFFDADDPLHPDREEDEDEDDLI
ncbi:AAA family ATPase [Rhodopirellula sp. P2]|uniref:AAA family ATPase n=1 Tax=Rhodopirellula sp. P2 TaxID=2127060 RepID=UPI0023680C73|nr:AAA family ATPase [Rhodopirellula sp. P2]WDQ19183.1 AAA family ATPase [Rhodopirellula sp. P2]